MATFYLLLLVIVVNVLFLQTIVLGLVRHANELGKDKPDKSDRNNYLLVPIMSQQYNKYTCNLCLHGHMVHRERDKITDTTEGDISQVKEEFWPRYWGQRKNLKTSNISSDMWRIHKN